MTIQRISLGSSFEARKAEAANEMLQVLSDSLGEGYKVTAWWNTEWSNLAIPLDTFNRGYRRI